MADGKTEIQTTGQVDLKDNASKNAERIAKGLDAIAQSAKFSAFNLSQLEARLDEINRLEKENKLNESQANTARSRIYSSVKSEAKAHEENARAINNEAKANEKLAAAEKKRADAYKKKTDFNTSAEGLAEKQKNRDLAYNIETGKNYRQDEKTKAKMAEIEEKTANRKLREQLRKDRIKNSRRGANSVFGNLLVSGEHKIRDKGLLGRVTGDMMGLAAAGLTRGPAGLLAAALGKAANAAMDFRDATMEAYGSVEKIKTQMGVVFGSKAQAEPVFQDIADYAVKSPFGIESVSEFAVLLKQSGVYSSDLLDTLKMIGDTAGGDNEKMKRIANNYAQIVAVGKASMLDMRQFAYAGIPIYKEVADYLKVSQSELRSMISDGKVSAETIEEVFKRMTSKGGVFNEATEKGALTLSARRQNLEDAKTMAKAELGKWYMSWFDSNGIGGFENKIIDKSETFYESLQKWGETTNLVRSVNQLATAKSEYQQIEDQIKFIENSGISKDEKEEILNYLNSKKETLGTTYNKDNLLATLSLGQKAVEARNKAVKETQEISDSIGTINSKLLSLFNKFETPGIISNARLPSLPETLKQSIFNIDKTEIEQNISSISDFIKHYSSLAAEGVQGADELYQASIGIQELLLKKIAKISRQEELSAENGVMIGELKPLKIKSTYESQLAAGSVAATSAISLLEDMIDKTQKSANGSQTVMGEYNEMRKNSPQGKLEEEERQEKEFQENKANAKKVQELLDKLSAGKISLTDLPFEQILNLETNWANKDTGYYGENVYDFLTGMDETAVFTSDQTKKNFIDLAKDTEDVLQILKNNTDNQELLNKIEDFENVLRYGKLDLPETVKNFFEKFRAVSEYLEEESKQNLSIEDKKRNEQLQVMLASAFRRNDYSTFGQADMDQSVLDSSSSKTSGINSIDLEPLWKRIIANVTGLNVDMMQRMGAKGILENQLAPTFSRQLVSSAIASIYKNGGASGKGKGSLQDAYKLLSFDGFKTLGSGDDGGNLASYKSIASENKKSSNSKPTAVNYSSPAEKVAQINWKQAEKNILNAAKSGVLNSGTLQLLQQTMDNRIDVLSKLVQASFEQQENGQYVKGQDFNNAFVNAFSGLQIGADETVKATVNGKEEVLTFDKEKKQFRKANGDLIEATDDVKYSLENLSEFIQKYGKQISDAADELKTAAIKQGTYEASKADRRNSFIKTQASIFAAEYLNSHPEMNKDGMLESLTDIFYKRLADKIKDDTEISSLDDVKKAFDLEFLKYNAPSGSGNIAEYFAETARVKQENDRKDAFHNEFNRLQLSTGGSDTPFRAGIKNVLGITGSNTYREQKAMDSLGFSGNWKDISEDFGTGRMELLKSTSPENMSFLQKQEMQALGAAFGEEGQSSQSLIDSILGDPEKLEQASSLLRDMDATALDTAVVFKDLGNGIKDTMKSFASSSIIDTTKQIGENLIAGNDAMEGCGKRMKELGAAAMSNLSSLFVQAGLSLIATKPHMWAAGAALIAAGGMAGIISGMMSGSSDEDSDEDEAAKLRSIKEDLSDLLEQARNDAIYYENELRHRNALSTGTRLSSSTKASSVHDALISSNGNIITTDPKDYLIATKHPEELAGGAGGYSPKISFNVVNKSSGQVSSSYKMSKDSDGSINIEAMIEDKIVEMISSSKTDDAFTAREARKNGRSVVA